VSVTRHSRQLGPAAVLPLRRFDSLGSPLERFAAGLGPRESQELERPFVSGPRLGFEQPGARPRDARVAIGALRLRRVGLQRVNRIRGGSEVVERKWWTIPSSPPGAVRILHRPQRVHLGLYS